MLGRIIEGPIGGLLFVALLAATLVLWGAGLSA